MAPSIAASDPEGQRSPARFAVVGRLAADGLLTLVDPRRVASPNPRSYLQRVGGPVTIAGSTGTGSGCASRGRPGDGTRRPAAGGVGRWVAVRRLVAAGAHRAAANLECLGRPRRGRHRGHLVESALAHQARLDEPEVVIGQ